MFMGRVFKPSLSALRLLVRVTMAASSQAGRTLYTPTVVYRPTQKRIFLEALTSSLAVTVPVGLMVWMYVLRIKAPATLLQAVD